MRKIFFNIRGAKLATPSIIASNTPPTTAFRPGAKFIDFDTKFIDFEANFDVFESILAF